MDLPQEAYIRSAGQRLLVPFSPARLATLGQVLPLAGARVLDLGCGKGELLCTWARDHGIQGLGADVSGPFVAAARDRAQELSVAERVAFRRGDATGFRSATPYDVAACLGATWIAGGTSGTLELLRRNLRPDGIAVLGREFWARVPRTDEALQACWATHADDRPTLPGLIETCQRAGWDVIEMVCSEHSDWERFLGSEWSAVRAWLDDNPGTSDLHERLRLGLRRGPVDYAAHQRDHLGWGVVVLRRR